MASAETTEHFVENSKTSTQSQQDARTKDHVEVNYVEVDHVKVVHKKYIVCKSNGRDTIKLDQREE